MRLANILALAVLVMATVLAGPALAADIPEGSPEELELFRSLYGQTISPAGTAPDWDGDGAVDGGDYVRWLNAAETYVPDDGNNGDNSIVPAVPAATEFTIRCMTPDTGGLQLPPDTTAESSLTANVGGTTTVIRAGLDSNGNVVVRSLVPFEYGYIIVLDDHTGLQFEFEMRPGWSDGLSTGCVRLHP